MRIGILGGGQLAMFLAQAAKTCGHTASCFVGSITRSQPFLKYIQQCDLILFENEFVDCSFLKTLSKRFNFVPHPATIKLFQDKIEQKKILQSLHIPVLPYQTITSANCKNVLDKYFKTKKRGVIKFAQFGYDGKGTMFIDRSTVLGEIKKFINAAHTKGSRTYLEPYASFKHEIAIQTCLSLRGSFRAYPVVFSVQKRGTCHYVYGPATSFGLSLNKQKKMAEWGKKIQTHSGLYGILGMECFELENGTIIVNELAPRVHNTGHYTLDFSKTSQFKNHILAATGASLGSTSPNGIFLMFNWLGPSELQTEIKALPPQSIGKLHWYFKEKVRAGRKMGHTNLALKSKQDLEVRIRQMMQAETKWHQCLKKNLK